MDLKNIFKMEMFKNAHDRPYMLIVAVLTGVFAILSIMWVYISSFHRRPFDNAMLWATITSMSGFALFALALFCLLYPFHLLNMDYKNKVVSLMIASGVGRSKYYLVKVGATLCSTLLAIITILAIPFIAFVIVDPNTFVDFVRRIIDNFNIADTFILVVTVLVSLIATVVTLTTAVIITKGKVQGIFLYFAFALIASIVGTFVTAGVLAVTVATDSAYTASNSTYGSHRSYSRELNYGGNPPLPTYEQDDYRHKEFRGGYKQTPKHTTPSPYSSGKYTLYTSSLFTNLLQTAIFLFIGMNVMRKQDL